MAAEDEGLELPYACRLGCCTSCTVKVKEGEMWQPHSLGLSKELRDQVRAGGGVRARIEGSEGWSFAGPQREPKQKRQIEPTVLYGFVQPASLYPPSLALPPLPAWPPGLRAHVRLLPRHRLRAGDGA